MLAGQPAHSTGALNDQQWGFANIVMPYLPLVPCSG